MGEITSFQNPLVKRIRALKHKKYRSRERCFWAEGIRIVREALELGWDIEALVWSPDLLRSEEARQAIADAPMRKVAVSAQVFRGIAERENPQGLGALIRIPTRRLADLAVDDETFLVVLEAPQGPGNVGTIVRTVDCAGGTGVILLGNAADPYDPQAVRASMGSLFAIPVVAGVAPSDFVAWARETGLWLVGTSASAQRCYREATYQRPLALLFGSEQKGLSNPLRQAADEVVRIPMRGRASSLNLASAVAVIVFQAASNGTLA